MAFDDLRQILALPSVSVPKGTFGAGSAEYKFGFNGDVGAAEETIWAQGGLYAFPPSASVMTVSSSDANDAAAGTGARTVQIYGLDADYLAVNEIVTLNGQTPVTTTNSYLRMERAIVRSAGSGEEAAGIIYAGTGAVTAGVPANVFTTIAQGENQTLQAFKTIPAGKMGWLNNVIASSFGNANFVATVRLKVRPEGEVFQTKDKFLLTRGAAPFPRRYATSIPEKADIQMTAIATGSLDVSGSFELILENA